MKTNMYVVNTKEGAFWGTDAGCWEYGYFGNTECCNAYNLVGVGIVGIETDGSIVRNGSLWCGNQKNIIPKRGRRSLSHNKEAAREARAEKLRAIWKEEELPF